MPRYETCWTKAAVALGLALVVALPATAQVAKSPSWSHAFDLKCRSSKEPIFEKARAFGIEVFRDENNGNWVYISETGSIAVVPGK